MFEMCAVRTLLEAPLSPTYSCVNLVTIYEDKPRCMRAGVTRGSDCGSGGGAGGGTFMQMNYEGLCNSTNDALLLNLLHHATNNSIENATSRGILNKASFTKRWVSPDLESLFILNFSRQTAPCRVA